MINSQEDSLPFRAGRFSIRDLLVDAFLVAICCGLIRLMPERVGVAGKAIYVGFVVLVVITGRLTIRKTAGRVGLLVGVIIGIGSAVLQVFTSRTPNYSMLVGVVPLYALVGAAVYTFIFQAVWLVQHVKRGK